MPPTQRGFKTGGITLNGVPTDPANGEPILLGHDGRPEEVDHYELGLKTQFANRTVTANLAVFRTDVDDFQATVNNDQVPSASVAISPTRSRCEIQGVEADFS